MITTIHSTIKEKHQKNEVLKEYVKHNGFFNFKELLVPGELHYIFHHNNLVFWSDNHFFPEYKKIKSDYAEKYIELKSGKFLVIKDTLNLKGEQFEVIDLLPLYYTYNIDNQYIKSGPNAKLFSNRLVEVNNYLDEATISIISEKKEYLFSVKLPANFIHGSGWVNYLLLFSILVFVCVLSAVVWLASEKAHRFLQRFLPENGLLGVLKNYEANFVLLCLLIYGCIMRLLLLLLELPHTILNIRFFNKHYYNWHFLTPSPGDLLLHALFLVFYLLVVKHLSRQTRFYLFLSSRNDAQRWKSHAGKSFLMILSLLALFLAGKSMMLVLGRLKYPLDVSGLPLQDISTYLMGILLVLACGLFLGLARSSYELVTKTFKGGVLCEYLPALTIFILLVFRYDALLGVYTMLCHGLFFFACIVLRLPPGKHSFDYSALVFFTLGSLCTAFIAAFSLMRLYPDRDLELKTNFINQQLVENNLLGENLLNDISKQVALDPYVSNAFSNPMFSVKDMEEKVRRFYLGNYLNRYDIQVKAFDDKGNSLGEDDLRNFWEVRNKFGHKLYKTNYPEVFYYITQQNQLLKNYLSLVTIYQDKVKTGTILIDLQPKKIIPNSILPVLLVDKKSETPQSTNDYSYAVFNNGKQTNSFGNFSFRKELTSRLLQDSLHYNNNTEINDQYFLVSDLGKGRKIIVQSEAPSYWVLVSNVSFFFVLLQLALSFFFVGNLVLFNFDRFYNSLTFKIQFYSVMAFFIPVGLVSGGVLTAAISSYNQELKNHFKENATNIAYALSEELQNYYQKGTDFDKLNEHVLRIARLYNTDVNIFRKSGILLVSSSPVIYKAGLISPLLDPTAYSAIRQEKNRLFLQEETIGKLKYNHVYIQVGSSESGEELGIISIPFFASGQELSNRITNTLKIIVNIATLTFMVFLFFSYTASNFITYPLKLITHRIRKTNLESNNRPLNWESKDELGLLIREYNLMLQKLEQNKRSLSISQKENAWREVAQQVAHEIKNPLTPIKLSLQHMQRVLSKNASSEPGQFDKTISNLIGQVETLDGIASSFSIYAKMPVFYLETVDLQKVVTQVVEVYAGEKKESVHTPVLQKPLFAIADEKMLGRIVANLLLNAFQAVPSGRSTHISVMLEEINDMAMIYVTDNGTGIPLEVQDKIFEPHFSTKFSGSGIGLYIAKKGIEQMGGSIWFKTGAKEGTTFVIALRMATPEND